MTAQKSKPANKLLSWVKRSKYSLLIISVTVLSGLLKLFYVFKLTHYQTFLTSDCGGYWSRAQERFAGNIFSENQWDIMPTGYHIILCEMFKIIHFFKGDPYRLEIILILQIVLCTFSVYALYRIALTTVRHQLVALIAAGTYAFSFVMIFFKAFILSENIAIPLAILSVFFLFQEQVSFLIISGVLLAVASWVRPWYAILFLPFACYLFFSRDRRLPGIKKILSFTLPFIMVISLVVLENNYISKGKLRGLGANGGVAFYLALARPYQITVHYPDGGYSFFIPSNTSKHPENGNIDTTVPFNDNKYYFDLGKAYIKKNPGVFFRKFIDLKEMIFSPLFPETTAVKGSEQLVDLSRRIMFVMFLFSLMIWAVFKSGRADNAKLWLLVSVPISLIILNYFFNTEYRYFYAFAFVLHILCFASIAEILRFFSKLKHRENISAGDQGKMSPYRNAAINLLLVLGGILIGFISLELIARPHDLKFENLILKNENDLVNKFYSKLFKYDANLGWLPMSNVSVQKWGGTASILDNGIRSNGGHSKLNNSISILALGDSFTFGDLVPDDKTWPSFLEQLTHARVYNAGVSSYGLDQIILRLEQERLIEKYRPQVIVLSIIYDDTQRCLQTIRHGDPKPYFILKNNELILQKQRVFYGLRFDWFRQIFGYSYICHKIMGSRFPAYWWSGTSQDFHNINGDALKISELLFDRFMKSAQSKDVVFLVQEWAQWDLLESLIKYVKNTYPKVHVLNMTPLLIQMRNTNPQELARVLSGHMTPKGNKLVAQLLAAEIMTFPDVKSARAMSTDPNQAAGY